MPGGSLFMRNPPPPLEICFPDGNYPDDAPRYTLNPDMTICKTETGKSAVGGVLVDFGKKNMEWREKARGGVLEAVVCSASRFPSEASALNLSLVTWYWPRSWTVKFDKVFFLIS